MDRQRETTSSKEEGTTHPSGERRTKQDNSLPQGEKTRELYQIFRTTEYSRAVTPMPHITSEEIKESESAF